MGGAEVFRIVAKIQTNAKTAIAELGAVHGAGAKMATKLRASFTKVANFAKKVLIVGLVAVTAVAAAMFVSAVKRAAEFEQSMAMVKAVTGATGKEFEDLEAKAKSLGQTSKFTMVEIAEGMEFLGRAGFETNEIIDAMDGVVALAASQMMSLGQAADITSNILTGFGLDASEADRVANLLAATAASANVNVEMLGETMKYVAPLAAAAGWSLEETAAAAGKLGDAGIQASMAGTSLRMAVASLMSPTAAVTDALAGLNLTIDDLTDKNGDLLGIADVIGVFEEAGADASDMLDIFGLRAGPALTILLNEGKESLESYTDEITGTTAALDQMATQQDTLSGQTTILKGSWDLFMVTIGQKIIPHLKDLVQNILIPLVNRMVAWAEKTDIIDRAMAKLNAGIKWMIDNGPMLINIIKGIGIAIAALGIAGLVMSMTPLKLIIMAVSAVVLLAIANWDRLKAIFDNIKPLLPLIAAGFAAIVAVKISMWVGTAISSFSSLAVMLGTAGPVGLAIAAAVAGIVLLRKAFTGAANESQAAIDKASTLAVSLEEVGDAADRTEQITSILNGAINMAGSSLNGLVESGQLSVITLSEMIEEMKDLQEAVVASGGSAEEMASMWQMGIAEILGAYQSAVPGIASVLDGIVAQTQQAGSDASQGFADGMTAGQPDVEAAATGIADTAIDTVEEELEIKSPSAVMFEAGQEVGQGFADGIEDMNDEVEDAVKSQTELIDEALGDTQIGFLRWGKWVLNFSRELKEDTVDELRDFVNGIKQQMGDFLSTIGDGLSRNVQLRKDYEAEILRIKEGGFDDEADLLAEAEARYEENRRTMWDILREGVRDFLKALRQKLLLKAAEHTAIAIAQTLLLLPTAIQHWAAAAAYTAGGLGLALAGFAKGGIAMGPMMGIVGEGPDPELMLPLNRSVLADVGQGIVEATQAPGMSMSSQEITVNVAEGAIFNVREEADIDKIGRALGNEFDSRLREEGLVVPV